jgi:CHAT domain-containing protein/Flp pilus assembly protein TadD
MQWLHVSVVAFLALSSCGESGQAQYLAARARLQKGDLAHALIEAEQGRKRYAGTPLARQFTILKAEILIGQRNVPEALPLLQEELPAPFNAGELAIRRAMNRAFALTRLGRYKEAEDFFAEARRVNQTFGSREMAGEIEQREGNLAVLRGDFDVAERQFRAALANARAAHQPYLEANSLGSLGFLKLQQEHFGEAVDWFQESVALSRKTGAQAVVQRGLGNIGHCYFQMGDFSGAMPNLTEAERLSSALALYGDQLIWLTNIGMIHLTREEFRLAERDFLSALEIARRLHSDADMAVCLNDLALVAARSNQFDRARTYNQEALAIKRKQHNRSSELHSLFNESVIAADEGRLDGARAQLAAIVKDPACSASLRWESLAYLGNLCVRQGRKSEGEAAYQKAIENIDVARADLGRDEYRLSLRSSVNRYYERYVELLMSQGLIERALDVAEFSRARVLTDKFKIQQISRVTERKGGAQRLARKLDVTILSYWLAPERSYLWVIAPSGLKAFTLPPAAKIDELVDAHRRAIAGPRDPRESANAAAVKLYEILVQPARSMLAPGSRIIVIPDGSVHTLNMETLLAPGEPGPHYWIEDAVLSTATSIALLDAPARAANSEGPRLLLIGDPVSPGAEFPALLNARAEILSLRASMPRERVVSLEREVARPSAYAAANPENFSWIHFAAHGVAQSESPLDSAIVLSREGDSYKLYARDIARLPLKADLVTVSACYGSGSRNYSGQGLVGLAWAFLLAGAHNVIASLWEVNDRYTPQLMTALYQRLQAGDDPAHALRAAKLSLLHSEYVCRNPRYWGPFLLYTGY